MVFLRILGWIFVPYAMIFIQWKNLRVLSRTFGVIWAVFCASAVVANMSNHGDKTKEVSAPVPSVQTVSASTEDKAAKEKAVEDKAKSDAEAANSLTPDNIKQTIIKQLGEKANTENKPPKVADVKVNDDLGEGVPEGSKIVILTLNGDDDSLTTKPNEGLWMDTLQILKPIFQNQQVYQLNVNWQMPLVDTYGNSKDGNVMGLKFTRKEIDKINWNQFLYTNIPDVSKDAGYYWEHPALTK